MIKNQQILFQLCSIYITFWWSSFKTYLSNISTTWICK